MRGITALALLAFFVSTELYAEISGLYVVGKSTFRPYTADDVPHLEHGNFRPIMPVVPGPKDVKPEVFRMQSNMSIHGKFRPLSPKVTPVIVKRPETIELYVPRYPIRPQFLPPSPFR